jgi:hypothetical protein
MSTPGCGHISTLLTAGAQCADNSKKRLRWPGQFAERVPQRGARLRSECWLWLANGGQVGIPGKATVVPRQLTARFAEVCIAWAANVRNVGSVTATTAR